MDFFIITLIKNSLCEITSTCPTAKKNDICHVTTVKDNSDDSYTWQTFVIGIYLPSCVSGLLGQFGRVSAKLVGYKWKNVVYKYGIFA